MSDTIQDVEALPTVQDDPRVEQLTASLEQLQSDLTNARDALGTARAEADAAKAEVEELEIEQYADPDVTESDVQAARAALASEQAEVERLESKVQNVQTAIERVDERLGREQAQDAAARLYDAYAPVLRATTNRALDALSEAIDAVEAMNAAHEKAEHQGVKTEADATRTAFGVPVGRLMRLKKPDALTALREVKEKASGCMEYIDRAAPDASDA